MTFPFLCAARHKMTIKGTVIRTMFFGCRVSGEKNGIFEKVETYSNLTSSFWR